MKMKNNYFFIYKIEFILWPNPSVYVCEAFSWRLEPRPLTPTLYKHLYLWSDYHVHQGCVVV